MCQPELFASQVAISTAIASSASSSSQSSPSDDYTSSFQSLDASGQFDDASDAVNLPIRRVSDPDIITPRSSRQILVSNEELSIAPPASSSCESSSSYDDTSSLKSDDVSGRFDDESKAVQIRRNCDPDIITPRTSRQILVSNEELSIASSVSWLSSDDDTSSVQSDGARGQFDDASDENSSVCEELTDAKRSARSMSVSFADDSQDSSSKTNSTQLTFEDLFQRWQTSRVVNRRYPSVKAFPALKPFEGFDESNTALGYTFGLYFDRWYAKQQERSQDSSSLSSKPSAAPKRPPPFTGVTNCDTDVDSDTSPRSAKKVKLHDPCTASSIEQQQNLNSVHKWNAANAVYRSKMVKLPDSFVPGPYTVIVGRSLKTPGCFHLRNMTDQYAKEYKYSDSVQKSRIVTTILTRIYAKAPIGAFVRCKAGHYYEVEDLTAPEKIVAELIAGVLQIYHPWQIPKRRTPRSFKRTDLPK